MLKNVKLPYRQAFQGRTVHLDRTVAISSVFLNGHSIVNIVWGMARRIKVFGFNVLETIYRSQLTAIEIALIHVTFNYSYKLMTVKGFRIKFNF
ncbi:MAG: hypothetical protein EZS28_049835, partial [Streblomastix strix]